ncbi:MAG TPA: CRISPR-associated endonuclease Cas3'', partial [Myxococcota bacterium]|nr:CRISPR-associated endonuclease Cas3'' [Myxococcota bacterium]
IQQLLTKELVKRGLEGRALLLTGRIRPADRDRLLKDWKAQISADREGDPEKPLVLVATQTVEVGANLSFDALITEAAPLDALRQRFGRLDRKGKNIRSEAYILCRKNQKEDPVYGSSLEDTWKWLNKVATQEKKGPKRVDFGISALQPLLTDDIRSMLAPRAEAPVLLKSHMNAWLQTAPAPAVDPEVAPFLHGEGGKAAADVQLVWRADLPETLEEIQDQLSALPPMQRESLAVPIWALLAWLTGQEADPSDLEGVEGTELRRARAKNRILRWSSEGAEFVELDDQRPGDTKIRPGDTLVFSAKQGGCDAFGWNPASTEPVADLADEVQLSRPDLPQYSLRLRWDLLQKHLTGEEEALEATRQAILTLAAIDQEEGDAEDAFDTFLKCITKVSFEEEFSWWHSCLSQRALAEGGRDRFRSLSVVGRGDRLRLVLRPSKQERAALWTLLDPEAPVGVVKTVVRVPGMKLHEEDSDFSDDDERSLLTSQVTLADHSGGVQGWARTFATRCGLGADLIRDLAFAGWLHDVGKADRRMQALFYGGSLLNFGEAQDLLLAKSGINAADPKARERAFRLSNYPKGMRHEVLSVAMLQGNPELLARAVDPDLLQHLVGTHHGRGRPLPPPQPDPSPRLVQLQHGQDHLSARTDHGLDRWGSGWVDRFWSLNRRYGPWALAYLEAILRLADHRRSEWEERNLREVSHV